MASVENLQKTARRAPAGWRHFLGDVSDPHKAFLTLFSESAGGGQVLEVWPPP